MKGRSQSQIQLPPMEVRSTDQRGAAVQKTDKPDQAVHKEEATRLASRLFDAALTEANIETPEAAFLFGVSDSLVWKMRSQNEPQCPSFAQLLMLPPSFHIALIQQMDGHFGLGRALLARIQQTLGTLGLLVR